jgi:hypothetical protein
VHRRSPPTSTSRVSCVSSPACGFATNSGVAGGRLPGQGAGTAGADYVNTPHAKLADPGSKLPKVDTGTVWTAGDSVEVAWTVKALCVLQQTHTQTDRQTDRPVISVHSGIACTGETSRHLTVTRPVLSCVQPRRRLRVPALPGQQQAR